jgi:hypothetical protein
VFEVGLVGIDFFFNAELIKKKCDLQARIARDTSTTIYMLNDRRVFKP